MAWQYCRLASGETGDAAQPCGTAACRLAEQEHRADNHHRAADEKDGRPARLALIVTPLRTTLGDERRLVFFRGREHAGETATGGGCGRFERHQGSLGGSSADRFHSANDIDRMVKAGLPLSMRWPAAASLTPASRRFCAASSPATAAALPRPRRDCGRCAWPDRARYR